jgi:predicted nucleotide-binding protein
MSLLDTTKQQLVKNGFSIKSEKRLGNETGTQLTLESGQKVNIFDNGSLNVQGKKKEDVESVLFISGDSQVGSATPKQNNKVFVVYGHDSTARAQLEAMLRRWGLEPLILDQLPSEGQTIIEKLISFTSGVNFAVVLATPDDEGYRSGHPDEKTLRARQNVVLEMGMLLSLLGREKVAILLKQGSDMERPSDIQGLIYIPFKDNLEKDAGVLLAKEMHSKGFNIPLSKL